MLQVSRVRSTQVSPPVLLMSGGGVEIGGLLPVASKEAGRIASTLQTIPSRVPVLLQDGLTGPPELCRLKRHNDNKVAGTFCCAPRPYELRTSQGIEKGVLKANPTNPQQAHPSVSKEDGLELKLKATKSPGQDEDDGQATEESLDFDDDDANDIWGEIIRDGSVMDRNKGDQLSDGDIYSKMLKDPRLPPQTGNTSLVVGEGTSLLGLTMCTCDIVVCGGCIEGDLTVRTLYVAYGGTVTGTVVCDVALICGTVEGKILVAKNHLMLGKTARVVCKGIGYGSLSVQNGGCVEGVLEHLQPPTSLTPGRRDIMQFTGDWLD